MKKINISGMHPPNLVKKERKIFTREIVDYLDKKGNFKYGKNSNCPVCGSSKIKFKFFKNGFNFVKCQKCNLIFVNPRPTADFLKKYYSEGATYRYMQNVILHRTAKFRIQIILKPKLKIVNRFFKKNKNKLLDIGCASGHFLNLARKVGWDCYGVEPSRDAVEFLKKNFSNVKVFNTTIEELESKTKFDVITCWEVIEHVLDPLGIFKKIYSLLSKKGMLVLSVPNSEGFDMLILKELADANTAPNHLNFFNPKAITLALKGAGFKKVEVLTPGIFDLDKIVNVIKEENSQGLVDRFLLDLYGNKYPEYDKFIEKFTSFLQENKWSGHMVVVGFK